MVKTNSLMWLRRFKDFHDLILTSLLPPCLSPYTPFALCAPAYSTSAPHTACALSWLGDFLPAFPFAHPQLPSFLAETSLHWAYLTLETSVMRTGSTSAVLVTTCQPSACPVLPHSRCSVNIACWCVVESQNSKKALFLCENQSER